MFATPFTWRHRLAAAASISAAAIFLISDESHGIVADAAPKALLWALFSYASTLFLLGGWRFAWVVGQTFSRDVKGILVFVKMKLIMRKHVRNKENIPSLWNKTVETYGEKVCFFFENQSWSFNEVHFCLFHRVFPLSIDNTAV